MPVDPASLDLPTLTALAGLAANEHLLAEVRAAGHPDVRIAHGYVFQHLVEGAPTVGELAARLGVTQQAASKAVAELEGLGYVERRTDPADARIRRLALTERGAAAVAEARTARAALEAAIAEDVGEDAVATARAVLVAVLRRTGGLEGVAARRVRPPGPSATRIG